MKKLFVLLMGVIFLSGCHNDVPERDIIQVYKVEQNELYEDGRINVYKYTVTFKNGNELVTDSVYHVGQILK